MNMPGFTAGASLYQTSEHTHLAVAVDFATSQVVPAVPNLKGCENMCDRAALCDDPKSSQCKMYQNICTYCEEYYSSQWASCMRNCVTSGRSVRDCINTSCGPQPIFSA